MQRLLQTVLTILFFTQSIFLAQSQELFINNTQNRTFTNLNGKWEYIVDPYKTGGMGGAAIYKNEQAIEKTDCVEYSFDTAETLYVPGSFNA